METERGEKEQLGAGTPERVACGRRDLCACLAPLVQG